MNIAILSHSSVLNIKVVRTDHSLHELSTPYMIGLNSMTGFFDKADLVNHVIAVSNAVRENGVIR